ncbi:aminoacyl-tRNA deacylase [Marisediminicola sp. LYQ85]|uniref:aminoacyl-tRNA deacylase n=1 Tax=Marisediminicola sp. LYQ85 TaxID=3391062 RepID=UPI00398337D2
MTDTTDGRARVVADAEARGVKLEIVARPPAESLDEAARQLGVEPHSIVKTLVVKRHDGDYLFALVPGDRQISWPKLRAVVGVNKLRMPEPTLALEATGFERGTITVFGSTTAWPVYADASIVGERIGVGAGDHDHQAFVEADDVIAAYGATVADITEPLSARGGS